MNLACTHSEDETGVEPVRWGVMGVAAIATERVIPAMQSAALACVDAIASRTLARARTAADQHGIARAHGSYAALLDDGDIEAVYIPLPNHMHLEWCVRALEAGKHVLCEKPITLTADEAAKLIRARERSGLRIEEAFTVRGHPQWEKVRELVATGEIGAVRAVQCAYSHTVTDRDDIRFRREYGGGALYDIGSYEITIARLVFADEPRGVLAFAERDPQTGVDAMTSTILDFPQGQATLTACMSAARYQHAAVIGTSGWIRADYPFAHAQPAPCRLYIGDSACVGSIDARKLTFAPVNQYTLQAERFSKLIRGQPAASWPLETALANMRVIDAAHRAISSGRWEAIGPGGRPRINCE